MNKLTIAAIALLLASTATAHAGSAISFKIDGQNVRVERPRHCASLDCLTVVAPGLSDKPIKLNNLKDLNGSKDKDADTKPAPAATTAPPAPAPVQQAPIQATAPAAPAAPAPATTVAAAPSVGFANNAQPAAVAAPAPAPVAAAPAPHPIQVAAAPAAAPTSPIGVWATEDNKGNVRIEQCGPNLCGFAEKGNERILIDMKPEGAKWSGHIRDPRNDKNYDSTFALKSPNALRVQGCALGGLICGGETWQRVS